MAFRTSRRSRNAASSDRNGISRGRPASMLVNQITGGNPKWNIVMYASVILFAILRKNGMLELFKDPKFWQNKMNFLFNNDASVNLMKQYEDMIRSLQEKDEMEQGIAVRGSSQRHNTVGVEDFSSVADLKTKYWMYYHSIEDSINSSINNNKHLWKKTDVNDEAIQISSCFSDECGENVLIAATVKVDSSFESTFSVIHPENFKNYWHSSYRKEGIYYFSRGRYETLLKIANDFQIGRKQSETDDLFCISMVRRVAKDKILFGMLSIELENVGTSKNYARTSQDILFSAELEKDEGAPQGLTLFLLCRFGKTILSRDGVLDEEFRAGLLEELHEIKKASEIHAAMIDTSNGEL